MGNRFGGLASGIGRSGGVGSFSLHRKRLIMTSQKLLLSASKMPVPGET